MHRDNPAAGLIDNTDAASTMGVPRAGYPLENHAGLCLAMGLSGKGAAGLVWLNRRLCIVGTSLWGCWANFQRSSSSVLLSCAGDRFWL